MFQTFSQFQAVSDTRTAIDPWFERFTIEVLRADHPDWAEWKKHNIKQSSAFQAMAKASVKAILAGAVESAQPSKGFRQRKKATKAQKEQERQIDTASLVDEVVDKLDLSDALQTNAQSGLNDLKPGIAQVLLRGWSGVNNGDTQEPAPCDLHHKLMFLGWEGVYVRHEGVDHFLAATPEDSTPLGKALAAEAAQLQVYEGNPRDAAGNLLFVNADQAYGPAPVGDAITSWLIEEANEASMQAQVDEQEVAEDLKPTPAGAGDASAA